MELKNAFRDFPGSSVVKTPCFYGGGMGSIPGQGSKMPHAMRHGQKVGEKKARVGNKWAVVVFQSMCHSVPWVRISCEAPLVDP